MKKLRLKLKSSRGETLVETLAALLIAALALTMLASVIGSTGKILQKSQGKLEAYDQENDRLAAQAEEEAEEETLRIILTVRSSAGQGDYMGGEVFLTGDRRAEALYYVNDTLGEDKKVIAYCLRRTEG